MKFMKTYVLDTNVLLIDPNAIHAFPGSDIIIPIVVIEELDNIKTKNSIIGKHSRDVNRLLESYRLKGSLRNGVPLDGGGTIKVVSSTDVVFSSLDKQKIDNKIISYMLQIPEATLITNDINVRIKCDALGVKSDCYQETKLNIDEFYSGVCTQKMSEQEIDDIFNGNTPTLNKRNLSPNQIVICKSDTTSKSVITRYKNDSLVVVKQYNQVLGLKPKNKEQNFSFDLLFDPDVRLVTLLGPSGTGKTLITLAAALDQLKSFGSTPRYEKLIVTRPIHPVGNDIGFLPGSLEEKMEPWISPIRDNLDFLLKRPTSPRKKKGIMNEPYLSLMKEKGLIEIEAISYIRGRSIPDAFIVVDECQNLSIHELKTILTRAGNNTKIVLTGDIHQVDNLHVDSYNNGLTYAIEKFKEHVIAGHVTLTKGERSDLATLASKIL